MHVSKFVFKSEVNPKGISFLTSKGRKIRNSQKGKKNEMILELYNKSVSNFNAVQIMVSSIAKIPSKLYFANSRVEEKRL